MKIGHPERRCHLNQPSTLAKNASFREIIHHPQGGDVRNVRTLSPNSFSKLRKWLIPFHAIWRLCCFFCYAMSVVDFQAGNLFVKIGVFCHSQDPKDKVRAGAFGDPWGVAKLLNLPDG